MITWPGKVVGGTNQLALRIQRLRSEANAAGERTTLSTSTLLRTHSRSRRRPWPAFRFSRWVTDA